MYPFGSGAPPNLPPNSSSPYPSPFGSGYPPVQQSAPYPGGQAPYPSNFQSPYPSSQQSEQCPYPSGQYPTPYSNPNPSYPSQTGYPPFGAGYPSMPSAGGYPSMPSAGGYPPMPSAGGYPPASNSPYGNPNPNPSYPSQQASYPTYPSSAPGSTNSSYPDQSPYPTLGGGSGGYPTQNMMGGGPGYPYGGEMASTARNIGSNFSSHVPKINKEVRSKGNPSVRPAANFNSVNDAKALRKAMKGFGTDENALIEVICRRSNEQRQMIARDYKTNYGKDLIEDIRSECSGNFEKLLVALMTPIVDYYAKELHDAMAGLGTDEDALIEVLATMTNYEIHAIKNAYEKIYGGNLESRLISETSGNFKRLLVSLCVGGRDESGVTDVNAAQMDARELLKAGELRVGTDESTFNMVLCQRNYQQLKLICEEYQKMTGHGLEKAIRKEFSGDIMEGLLAIIQCVMNKHEYFASLLKKSMAGFGTNDSQLIRICVTRSEIDMVDIKAAFERLFGKSLKSWIKGDTSGHYKHALYALIGEERSS